MAKADKSSKAKAEEKVEKETKAEEFEFTVQDIAEELDIKPASVRVQLRNKGIEKAGKSYGWDSKKEFNEILEQLRSSSKEERAEKADKKSVKKTKDEDEDDEKPAKKNGRKARDEDDEDEKPVKSKRGRKARDADDE